MYNDSDKWLGLTTRAIQRGPMTQRFSSKTIAAGTPCANIGAREIRKRRLMGAAFAAASVVLLIALMEYDAPRWGRLVLFVPLWMAGLGFFQAHEKT